MKSIRPTSPESHLKSSIIVDSKKDLIQINNSQYQIIDFLSKKSTVSVYLVQEIKSNMLFVAKKYKYDLTQVTPEEIKKSNNEDALLKKLNRLEAVEWKSKSEKITLQPFYSGINLYDLSLKQTIVSQEQRLSIIIKLIDQLKRIHQFGWIHADLQPSNIVIDFEEKNNEVTHIKAVNIVDFDQSLPLENNQNIAYIPMNSPINPTYYGYYFYAYLKLPQDSKSIPFTQNADFYALGGIAQHVLILSKRGMHEVWNHPIFYQNSEALKAFKAGCEIPLFVPLPNKH